MSFRVRSTFDEEELEEGVILRTPLDDEVDALKPPIENFLPEEMRSAIKGASSAAPSSSPAAAAAVAPLPTAEVKTFTPTEVKGESEEDDMIIYDEATGKWKLVKGSTVGTTVV